jgi:hypothetical protein
LDFLGRHIFTAKSSFCSDASRLGSLRRPRAREPQLDLIWRIRTENPIHGNAKISMILEHDHGLNLSESTVSIKNMVQE